MLRSSLTVRRSNVNVNSLRRWASSNNGCSRCRTRENHHYPPSSHAIHISAVRLGVPKLSHHRVAFSSMSTKPSFDDAYDEDDTDLSNEEYELKWIKRSPLDNYAKYDNYSEYESHNKVEEESLLNLMSEDGDDNMSVNKRHHTRVASMMQQLRDDGSRLNDIDNIAKTSQDEEKSLLNLLHGANTLNGNLDSSSELLYADYEEEEPLSDLLNETEDDTKASKYRDLQRLQLQLEIESTEEAATKYLLELKSARDRSDHASLPGIRKALGTWYEQLTDAIELEQWLYLNGDNRTSTSSRPIDGESDDDTKTKAVRDRTIYGPLLCLLPASKIAVLVAHTALSCTVADGDTGSKVVSAAMLIAQAMETEVNVSRALRVRARERKEMKANDKTTTTEMSSDEDAMIDQTATNDRIDDEEVDYLSKGISIDSWVYTATHLQRFLDEIQSRSKKGGSDGQQSLKKTGRVQPAIVRRRCQEILLAEGFNSSEGNNKRLSMEDFVAWDPVLKVKLGAALIRLLLDHTTFKGSEPAFTYSRKKSGEMKFNGFISIHPELLKLASTDEISSGSSFIPPRAMANTRCQPMVVPPKDWSDVRDGGYEILKVDFMRTRHCKTQKVSLYVWLEGSV